MNLCCLNCNSNDLKRVSLTYQEGLFRTQARTRLRAAMVGGSGPDLVVGRATTQGTQQSALSNHLRPPVKWSYLKVIFWSVLVFLSLAWIVFHANTVTTNPTTVISTPLTVFSLVSAGVFVFLLFFVWRHNHSTYTQRYAQWDRSFICQRCGAIIEQNVPGLLVP